jgi:hypothetical protein
VTGVQTCALPIFGQAFIKAYEEQVAQDRAKRKRG